MTQHAAAPQRPSEEMILAITQRLAESREREAALAAENESLRQAHRELESRMAERTAQLARREAALEASEAQSHALSHRLVQAQEAERRALARDLHDTSGQAMAVLNMGLARLRRDAATGAKSAELAEKCATRIDDLRQIAETVVEDLHRLSMNLRPASLDRYGLLAAIEDFITAMRKQTDIRIDFGVEGLEERLPDEVATALYRIVQEACANITRYAGASRVAISMRREGDTVRVRVEDDGRGFEVEEGLKRGRLGLLGMRERAEMLGGTLKIRSAPGQGTTVLAEVPVNQAAGNDGARIEPDALPAQSARAAGRTYPADLGRLAEAAELARAKALSDALVEITAGMARCEKAEDLLAFVLAQSAEAVGCEMAAIAEREGDHWVVTHGYGTGTGLVGRRVSDEDAPATVEVERTREMLVVNDARELTPERAEAAANYAIQSHATIPLLAGDKLLAVAGYFYHSAPTPFKPTAIEFLKRLSSLVSLAIENIQLREIEARQREQLAQRVEELETVLQVLPVGLGIAYDRECNDIRVNQAFADMLAIQPEANASLSADEQERPTNFRVLHDGRELAPEELPMQVAAAQGLTLRDLLLDIERDDGTTLTLLEYAAPLLDAQGKPRGSVGAFVDVTEQRRSQSEADAARRELEELTLELRAAHDAEIEQRSLLEAVLGNVPVGLAVIAGREPEIRMANAAYRALTPHPEVDPVGRRYTDVWPPAEGFDKGESWLARVIEEGEALDVQHHKRTFADGSERWFAFHVRQLLWQGQPAALVVLIDTTASEAANAKSECQAQELARVNERLQEERDRLGQSREEFRALAAERQVVLDAIADGLVVYDREGRIVRLNAVAQEILGYSTDTQGMSIQERSKRVLQPLKADGTAFEPDEYPAARALRGEVVRNEQMTLHVPARAGGVVRVMVSAAPIRLPDGTITGCVTTFNDIGELHRVGEELGRTNLELEAILSSIADGLVVNDMDGRVTRMSATALEMLDYNDEERALPIHERLPRRMQLLRPDGMPYAYDEYPPVRALRGEVVRGQELLMRTPRLEDSERWVLASAAPIRTKDGERLGAVTILTDVTDLHQTRSRLESANIALREQGERLAAQAAGLRRLAQLQEEERSHVANQLYNQATQVLAALKMQMLTLERRHGEGEADRAFRDLEGALDETIVALHELATRLRPAGLDRAAITCVLHDYVTEFAKAHGLAFRMEAGGGDDVRLPADAATAVFRTAQDALANIAQHAHASEVALRLGRKGDWLVVTLVDDGVGFHSKGERREGAGLIAMRERMEFVGGRLSVEGLPGGTRVTIEAPIEKQAGGA